MTIMVKDILRFKKKGNRTKMWIEEKVVNTPLPPMSQNSSMYWTSDSVSTATEAIIAQAQVTQALAQEDLERAQAEMQRRNETQYKITPTTYNEMTYAAYDPTKYKNSI